MDKITAAYLNIISEQSIDMSTQMILNTLGFNSQGTNLWSRRYGKYSTFIGYDEYGWHIWIDVGYDVEVELVGDKKDTLSNALEAAVEYINDINDPEKTYLDENPDEDLLQTEQIIKKEFLRVIDCL